jgi:hypothetical protein
MNAIREITESHLESINQTTVHGVVLFSFENFKTWIKDFGTNVITTFQYEMPNIIDKKVAEIRDWMRFNLDVGLSNAALQRTCY